MIPICRNTSKYWPISPLLAVRDTSLRAYRGMSSDLVPLYTSLTACPQDPRRHLHHTWRGVHNTCRNVGESFWYVRFAEVFSLRSVPRILSRFVLGFCRMYGQIPTFWVVTWRNFPRVNGPLTPAIYADYRRAHNVAVATFKNVSVTSKLTRSRTVQIY